MPAERVTMRRVREMLRYRFEQELGYKAISFRVGVVPSTVRETLKRAAAAGLSWPLPDDLSDGALEAALYREAGKKTGFWRCLEPDWPRLHREMQRKHVTLQILWDEYIAAHPDGYRYSRFCDLYRGWALKLPVTMRQNHAPGDRLFVDYAGDKLSVVVDRLTGELRAAHVFVAVLGASSLSYAEATWTEALSDWIAVNVNALEAIDGAPALCPTTPRSRSSRHASTIRGSIAAMPRWRPITAARCCRRGSGSRGTRPRSSAPCSSSSAGCSGDCGTGLAISRVLMPRAYIDIILSSKPGKRRWYLAIPSGMP